MKTNIALIGFMGAGKTAVGEALAQKLGREFIELDRLIAELAGMSIPEIFREEGEISFRELEIAATKRICTGTNLVIACGGGIVLNMINIDRLRETSRIIFLTASADAILKRTSADTTERPLLKVDDPVQRIGELVKFRKPFYERAADTIIHTSRFTVGQVVDLIIRRLKEDEGINL
ncbi:MAG TPA: shikimate kinase [Dehalococcoidia bacterium]|nr:shikimate kinase [Dehalococcoidia bacterium]